MNGKGSDDADEWHVVTMRRNGCPLGRAVVRNP